MKTLLMRLIRAALHNESIEALTDSLDDTAIKDLYHLSKKHDMVHLVGHALLPLAAKFPENEYFPKFKKQFMIAVLRYEKINYVLNEITSLFENEKIPHLPLKGSVLRDYYPEPWMRTSCDIDILIHEEDLERASAAITEKLGYQNDTVSRHDISFFTPNGVHFELHFSMIEDHILGCVDKPLERVWNYAVPIADGSCRYILSPEMFYYYHIAHMAKHFVHGGCGIRPFLDLHILKDTLSLDEEKLGALLSEGGLVTFTKEARFLADVWFEGAAHTELTKSMEAYLLSGGTYGTLENHITMQQTKKGGKFRYLLSRIFVTPSQLATVYPSLKKHKWLYPIYTVRRWFRLFLPGRMKRSVQELKATQNASNEDVAFATSLLKQLDL